MSGPGFLYKPGLGQGRLSAAGVDDCEALRTQVVLSELKGRKALVSGQYRRCWWGWTEIQPLVALNIDPVVRPLRHGIGQVS